jgi:uncharacterized membrane protein (TIGR01218 family)
LELGALILEKIKMHILERFTDKSIRLNYTVLESETGYYLIDNNRAWWGYIFPMLAWVIPEETKKIHLSKREVNTLLLDKKLAKKRDKDGKTSVAFATMAGNPIVISLLFPVIRLLDIHLPIYINILIVCLISGYMLAWRMKNTKNAKRILDIIGKENLSKQKMLIFPSSIFQGLKALFFFSLAIIFILIGKTHFLWEESNATNGIMFVLGAMGFFGYLYANLLLKLLAKYRIKMIDK